MRFCPSCKSFMLPRNEGSKTVLTCSSCGRTIKKFRIRDYKLTKDMKHKHWDILVVEGEKTKISDEKRKYLADLYGTEAYEED
ncbi:MAG: hypothetical protein V3T58_00470 [Candidatus Hydrothermarchaeales archaeon]